VVFERAPLIDGGRAGGATTTNLNIANVQTNEPTVSAGCHQQLRRGDQRGGRAFGSIAGRHYQPAGQSACHRPAAMPLSPLARRALCRGLPLVFQWRGLTNGGRISGASSATLTIAGVQTNDGGAGYQVVVTNNYGSATSSWLRSPSMRVQSPGNRRVRRSCWQQRHLHRHCGWLRIGLPMALQRHAIVDGNRISAALHRC